MTKYSNMKPKIWREGNWWFCSYYQRYWSDRSKGKTPYLAWYNWKYKVLPDASA